MTRATVYTYDEGAHYRVRSRAERQRRGGETESAAWMRGRENECHDDAENRGTAGLAHRRGRIKPEGTTTLRVGSPVTFVFTSRSQPLSADIIA